MPDLSQPLDLVQALLRIDGGLVHDRVLVFEPRQHFFIRYLSQAGNVVQASIEIKNGSTSGACTWSSSVDAICVFSAGTGRLTQFNLEVVVSYNAAQDLWYWDGAYSFGTRD